MKDKKKLIKNKLKGYSIKIIIIDEFTGIDFSKNLDKTFINGVEQK